MFASEKVMKDYLDHLLIEDDKEQQELESAPTATLEIPSEQTPIKTTESEYSAKIKKDFGSTAVKREAPSPKLKPIEKAIVADKSRPVKERPSPEINSLEMLLQQVSIQQKEAEAAELMKQQLAQEVEPEVDLETTLETFVQTDVKTTNDTKVTETTEVETPSQTVEYNPEDDVIDEPFQALFFDVAGLVLAVPLQELGGIHNLEEVTHLFGKPDWFMGVMVNRERKVNVVESARWVMPEKYSAELQAELDYKYLIMLGESDWGLAAEQLVTTEYIQPEDVKWRKHPGKRPWLLGTIKEKMCALLHVSDLIAMLDKGINARQE